MISALKLIDNKRKVYNNSYNIPYRPINNNSQTSFCGRLPNDIFESIRDIPHMQCACCGDFTMTSSEVKKFLRSFMATSKEVVENSALAKFKNTDAFNFLEELSVQYPKNTLRELISSEDVSENIKSLSPKTQLDIMQIGIYADGISIKAPKVVKKLEKYYEHFSDDAKNMFDLIDVYATKYPKKTFAEIFSMPEVIGYHSNIFENTKQENSIRKINVFKRLRELSLDLPKKEMKDLQNVNTNAMTILNDGLYKSNINKALIEDLYSQFTLRCSNKNIAQQIFETAMELPFNSSSPDKYIVDFVKNRKNDMDFIKMFVNEIQATFEHYKAKSKGGEDVQDNIIILCGKCNKERSNLPYPFFLRLHPEMYENIQKQLNKVMNFIMRGKLINYDNYPIGIRDTVLEETDNLIKLNIDKYLKFREEKALKSLELSKNIFEKNEQSYNDAAIKLEKINMQLEKTMQKLRNLKKQKRKLNEQLEEISKSKELAEADYSENKNILEKIQKIFDKREF